MKTKVDEKREVAEAFRDDLGKLIMHYKLQGLSLIGMVIIMQRVEEHIVKNVVRRIKR